MRALVLTSQATNRLSMTGSLPDDWLTNFDPPDNLRIIEREGFVYVVSADSTADSDLFVIKAHQDGILTELPKQNRLECFQRLLRGALSRFRPGLAKIPLDWRVFHSESLISFQTNRVQTGVSARAYIDASPEGTKHVFMYNISSESGEPLTRASYDADTFVDAVLLYEHALKDQADAAKSNVRIGHLTVDLNERFAESDISLGIPFSVWRDIKLNGQQRSFFDATFDGPMRLRGPAGSGKTLVLVMRFLKEIYGALEQGRKLRICFVTHAQETAEILVKYALQIDEKGIFLDPAQYSEHLDIEVTTLHGLANRFINTDSDNVQPLSLDGSEGRKLQFELVEAIVSEFSRGKDIVGAAGCRPEFLAGLGGAHDSVEFRAFCFDLSDEFANVLEAFGVRGTDEIAEKYLKARPGERALAKNAGEKRIVIELYRRFRQQLEQMSVVSLDQFTADFLAYLNSFRWISLRKDKGFDFVFADELHLFNAQERRTLGFLLSNPEPPRRIAVAYDPRQSPRNSFFPEATTDKDTVWSEAGLVVASKTFELQDVFRYTPQILRFLDNLNQAFPATDLAEDWALKFGKSMVQDGPAPIWYEHADQATMASIVAGKGKEIAARLKRGEHVAVLCLDHDRFAQYRLAGIFDGYVVIAGRDELGSIERFRKRPVLSMPEYVAGLQFSSVLLLDVNASLISVLGGGANGLHRFISAVYLGASRAKGVLELHADRSEGGLAEPAKAALNEAEA